MYARRNKTIWDDERVTRTKIEDGWRERPKRKMDSVKEKRWKWTMMLPENATSKTWMDDEYYYFHHGISIIIAKGCMRRDGECEDKEGMEGMQWRILIIIGGMLFICTQVTNVRVGAAAQRHKKHKDMRIPATAMRPKAQRWPCHDTWITCSLLLSWKEELKITSLIYIYNSETARLGIFHWTSRPRQQPATPMPPTITSEERWNRKKTRQKWK